MKNKYHGFSLLEFVLGFIVLSICLGVVVKIRALKNQNNIKFFEEKNLYVYIEAFEWFCRQNDVDIDGIWWAYQNPISKKRYFDRAFTEDSVFKIIVEKSTDQYLYHIQFFSNIQKRCLLAYKLIRIPNE